MFTGIVEEVGSVRDIQSHGGMARLVFDANVVIEGSEIGDSIAVNGCCLTVVDLGDGWWAADAVQETLSRTNLGYLGPGDYVNLERPVSLHTRLGGHLVQGHVDGVGTVIVGAPDLRIATPSALSAYFVAKGSVAVDGCSLTIVDVLADGITIAMIPRTAQATTLGRLRSGDLVNLEVDVIAKYVERLLLSGVSSPYREASPKEME